MKKIFVLLLLLFPICSFAQFVDISAVYGVAPYKISAGLKNGTTMGYNVSAAIVKLKFIDFGVQYSNMSKVTLSNVSSIGAFADIVVLQDDDKKNIAFIGVHVNYMEYGNIPTGGAYFKDGSIDSLATTVDKSMSYGLRAGYKRELTKHVYAYGLLTPTYSLSTIRYANVATNTCAVLYIPVMLGVAFRF